MNCSQFHERMNELLDSRCLPEQDPLLIQHAQACEACRSVLETQRQIFEWMRHYPPRRRQAVPNWPTIGVVVASAALVLLAVSFNESPEANSPTGTIPSTATADSKPALPVESTSPNLLAGLIHVDFASLLPTEAQLTDTAWLDQVSGGVKPLANSMTSTLNVLRRTWPSASPRNEGSDASGVTGAGTG